MDADLVVLRPRRGLPAHGRTWNAVVEQARTNVLLLPGAPASGDPVEPMRMADAAHSTRSADEARDGASAPMGTDVEREPVPA